MLNSEQNAFQLISASEVAAGSRTPVFERADYMVCTVEYVVSGRGFLEECGRRWELGPDDLYILRKHEDHRYGHDHEAPWKKIFFVADGPLIDLLFSEYLVPGDCVFRSCSGVKHYFEEMLSLSGNQASVHHQASLLFHNLLFELSRLHNDQNGTADTPETLLKKHLENSEGTPFRLQRYARNVGYTKSYLIRRFRAAYGCTPCEYLLQRRIRKAQDLLKYTTLQIKEIADQLGFSDQSAFSHCFRLRTGIAPGALRKR